MDKYFESPFGGMRALMTEFIELGTGFSKSSFPPVPRLFTNHIDDYVRNQVVLTTIQRVADPGQTDLNTAFESSWTRCIAF